AAKHKDTGLFCAAVLNAWSRFEKSGDAAKRDAAIAKAQSALTAAWGRAEDKSSAAGTDCAAAFIAASTAGAFIDSASGALVESVNAGLTLSSKDQAKCGAKIAKAAAAKCNALLLAESTYQKQRTKAGAADKRTAAIAKIEQKFAAAFAKAKGSSCPTSAT